MSHDPELLATLRIIELQKMAKEGKKYESRLFLTIQDEIRHCNRQIKDYKWISYMGLNSDKKEVKICNILRL